MKCINGERSSRIRFALDLREAGRATSSIFDAGQTDSPIIAISPIKCDRSGGTNFGASAHSYLSAVCARENADRVDSSGCFPDSPTCHPKVKAPKHEICTGGLRGPCWKTCFCRGRFQ